MKISSKLPKPLTRHTHKKRKSNIRLRPQRKFSGLSQRHDANIAALHERDITRTLAAGLKRALPTAPTDPIRAVAEAAGRASQEYLDPIKKLREASKRLIVDPYKNEWKPGKINIIAAGTGVGKTYHIMNTLIPSDIKEGYKKFIFMTVFTDNVEQDLYDMKIAMRPQADVYNCVKDFLEHGDDYPAVLVCTLALAVSGGNNKNSKILNNYLKDKKFAAFWDEAHFGGSSSCKAGKWNNGHCSYLYKASYYKFIQNLARHKNSKVFGFTATPLFEHKCLIPDPLIQSKMYSFLVKKEDRITQEELTEITSQLRYIKSYDSDKDGFEGGLRACVKDYLTFTKDLALLAKTINKHEPLLKLAPKTIMLCGAGHELTGISQNSINLNDQLDIVRSALDEVYDESLFIFGHATQRGYKIENLKGDVIDIDTFKEFTRLMKTSGTVYERGVKIDLRFVFHIEKFKFGLNVSNISHEFHGRNRKQQWRARPGGLNIVPVTILQIFGRAVRTNFGIMKGDPANASRAKCDAGPHNLNVNFVSDAIYWLVKNYSKSPVFDELRKYMMLQNSHTFFVPVTETYEAGTLEWKADYSAPLSISQFNNVDRTGFKKIIVPSGKERDAAYKLAQKDRCERIGCKCFEDFVTSPGILSDEFPLPEKERLDNYKKGLQVDHVDRNLNNLDPTNLKTYCPNAHSSKTMRCKDYIPK